jgi:flagellar M-ring protein FliF
VMRPALKSAPPAEAAADGATPAPGQQLSAVVDDQVALPGAEAIPALEAPAANQKLMQAREMAKQNPQAVASIVRGWVNGEAA